MANTYITNSKYPSNPQIFTINLNKVAGFNPEENPNFRPNFGIGEQYWKIFIYTSGLDVNGDVIQPFVADVIDTEENVNELVNNKLAELCALIDWSQQGQFSPELDTGAPIIVEQFPNKGQEGVRISSPIVIRVKDPIPGAGIDPGSVVMKVDGFDVVPNVTGNKFDYTFTFSPRPVYDS